MPARDEGLGSPGDALARVMVVNGPRTVDNSWFLDVGLAFKALVREIEALREAQERDWKMRR